MSKMKQAQLVFELTTSWFKIERAQEWLHSIWGQFVVHNDFQ